MLVIMSTTHRCVSQEHRTASFSYGYDIPQGLHQHHRVHTQQVKVDDLFLKITVVVPQLVHIERTKLMLFGSRNPIYLNMSFCGVLLVGFFFFAFCWWILQLRSEPMLGSSLFTALHLSLLQQPVLCRAVCAYSEISAHTGAVSLQMLLAFRGRFCFTQELAAGCTSPCCVYLPGDSVRLTYSLRGEGSRS